MKIAALLFQPQCHSCADACIVDICSYVQNSQRVQAYMLSRCLSIDASRSPFVTIFFSFFSHCELFCFLTVVAQLLSDPCRVNSSILYSGTRVSKMCWKTRPGGSLAVQAAALCGVHSVVHGMPLTRLGVVLIVDEGARNEVPCLLQEVMTAAVQVVQGNNVSHCWICSCRISQAFLFCEVSPSRLCKEYISRFVIKVASRYDFSPALALVLGSHLLPHFLVFFNALM